MVRLIMGTKGSGKTKQLIELINNAAKDEPGNVVCIEANRNLTYDIHYHIRLIDAGHFPTEDPVCAVLAAYLRKTFPELTVSKSASHREVIQYYVEGE